ncbi:YlxR family protein [Umezawaea sp. Da 62-37]|uniref:YlxR family protein n=1 Tax=Umezawaea sp. Da 62-37 TaxID=3075927 RepID=UPI0028F73564|nr:YlxR family protein [Umezawaea sp. Da 62-37]WNV89789.1 YlxR family protein [Umezawaea sp. Da 62-37]
MRRRRVPHRPGRPHPVRLNELQGIDYSVVERRGSVATHIGPARTCIGCRARTLPSELLRVVVVDGTLVPDTRRRLPGRGAWLHLDLDCLTNAERRRAFPRALRVQGPLAVDHVREHLEQHEKAAGTSLGEE